MRALSLAMLFFVPLGAQSVYYLPQVVDGTTGAASLHTTIILSNVDTKSAPIQISFTRDDGSPRQVNIPAIGSGSQFSVNLPPGGSQTLQTDGSGDGTAAAVTISSTAALGVSTIVSAYDLNGNPLSESGASASSANLGYLIPIDTTDGLNTGLGLFNPNTSASTLTFTLFDVNGVKMQSATASVVAGGHISRLTAGDLFPGLPDFQGTLAVTASAPVAAAAFRQNTAAPSYTLFDAVPQTSLGLNFDLPQIADGPSSATTLQTTFLLSNLSAHTATVTLALSQSGGAPWIVNIPGLGANSTFTVTLAPGGSAFLQTDGQGVSTIGAAAVNSTEPLGLAAVVTASDSNGDFLSETVMTQTPGRDLLRAGGDQEEVPSRTCQGLAVHSCVRKTGVFRSGAYG